MRPISIFFIFLGIGFVFFVYMVTLGSFTWWFVIYYVILGFLGITALIYPYIRWWFILGMIFGTLLLMYIQRHPFIAFGHYIALEKGKSFLPF